MARVQTHTQCRMRRENSEMVTWIPSRGAIVGKFVEVFSNRYEGLKQVWEVISTGATMESTEVNLRSQDHKNMSKATDSFVKHKGLFNKNK